jgi:hypothetical protein
MAQAVYDSNYVHSVLGVSSVDGKTPVAIMADPFTHALKTTTNATGFGITGLARRDENHVTTLICASSADGTMPIAIYANPTTQALFLKII